MNQEIPELELLIKVPAAARKLAVSKSKLYELINEGVIPHVRVGKCLRIPTRELESWIKTNTKGEGVGAL